MKTLNEEYLKVLPKGHYAKGIDRLEHLSIVTDDAHFHGFIGEPEIFLNSIIPEYNYICVFVNKQH